MRTLVIVALSLLTACEEETDCTTEALGSVSVTVVDASGAPMRDAVVSYAVDGGEVAECEAMSAGTWICGWEEEGEISIMAEARYYATAFETVTVESDECHVIPEAVELVLEGPACTDSEEPSVLVTVSDTDGPIEGATVQWEIVDDETDELYACEEQGADWACGWEVTGNLRVSASAPGYESAFADVTVDSDVCHVITEQVDLELAPSAP